MPIQLVVVTPEGEDFSGPVEEVVLPGVEGEFGVLELHERFLSALDHGCMEIRTSQGSRLAAISDGFAGVGPERVIVMVDSVVERADIDVAAARSARDEAARELESIHDDDDPRRPDLLDALARAEAQIAVAAR